MGRKEWFEDISDTLPDLVRIAGGVHVAHEVQLLIMLDDGLCAILVRLQPGANSLNSFRC